MVVKASCSQKNLTLVLIFCAAFIARGTFFGLYQWYDDRAWLAFDSEQYNNIAQQIAQGNGITDAQGNPNFYRLPGYPLFLACGYKLFAGNVVKTLWLQVIIASIIPVLVYFLARALQCSNAVAYLAAIFAVLHPGLIIYAGTLSTESLFLVFFLLFLYTFFNGIYRRNLWCFMASGAWLGVATLLRSTGQYALVFVLFYGILALWQRSTKYKDLGVLVGGWLAVVSWWLVRNYMLTGALFFHTLPGLHFLQYSAVYVVQDVDQCDYFQAKKKVFDQWDRHIAYVQARDHVVLHEYQKNNIAQRLAATYLVTHPLLALKHAVMQVARTCCTLYSSILLYVPAGTVYGDASLWFKIKLYLFPRVKQWGLIPLIYWELLFSLIMLVGSAFFTVYAFNDRALRILVAKMVPLMIFLIGLTVAYGCARLRFVIEPFVVIGAACGFLRKWV